MNQPRATATSNYGWDSLLWDSSLRETGNGAIGRVRVSSVPSPCTIRT